MTTKTIRLPANWPDREAIAFLQLDAGRAYIADQDGLQISPASEMWNADKTAGYLVFPDGSLWFVNNAADEVWADVADFLVENQMDALTF